MMICSCVFLQFLEWLKTQLILCLLLPPAGRLGNFMVMQLKEGTHSKKGQGGRIDDDDDDDEEEEEKVAMLSSLPITVTDADLCLSFWYQMFGEHAGSLTIRQRKDGDEEQILWMVSGQKDKRWREGRVRLPHSGASYQVTEKSFTSEE